MNDPRKLRKDVSYGEFEDDELVAALGLAAYHRQALDKAKQREDDMQERLERTEQWISCVDAREGVKLQADQVERAEARVREIAGWRYATEKDTHPAEGVQVRLYTRLDYSEQQCLHWCEMNAPAMIERRLKKDFDKVAVSLGAPVQETENPRVFIARDISQYMPVNEPDGDYCQGEDEPMV